MQRLIGQLPARIINMLLEKGVAQCNIDSHLTVTQGGVPNVENCRDALTRNGRTANIIISAVGAAPGGGEITLCNNAVRTISFALQILNPP